MARPSEVVWAARDEPPAGPSPGAAPPTVADTAERIRAGDHWRPAVRELLDALAVVDTVDATEPAPVSPQVDAYLAAVVEHVCSARGVSPPPWVLDPARFLSRFWWPDGNEAFTAMCLVHSPAAFRRRGIFIGATTVHRV